MRVPVDFTLKKTPWSEAFVPRTAAAISLAHKRCFLGSYFISVSVFAIQPSFHPFSAVNGRAVIISSVWPDTGDHVSEREKGRVVWKLSGGIVINQAGAGNQFCLHSTKLHTDYIHSPSASFPRTLLTWMTPGSGFLEASDSRPEHNSRRDDGATSRNRYQYIELKDVANYTLFMGFSGLPNMHWI